MDGNIATLTISTHKHTQNLMLGALYFYFLASTRISFRKCKLSVDLCEWISKVEGCTFGKLDFFISLEVQEMAGSSVLGSGQAVNTQLDCLRSHKYIWLCWLPDTIKAAKALKRWCLSDPRLHWSEMRLRLRRAHVCSNTPSLSSPPCIYNWRGMNVSQIYVYSTKIVDGCGNRNRLANVACPVYSPFLHLMVELSLTEVGKHERSDYW